MIHSLLFRKRSPLFVSTVGPTIAFSFRVASPLSEPGTFRLVTGGTGCDDFAADLTGDVAVPSTGDWSVFTDHEV